MLTALADALSRLGAPWYVFGAQAAIIWGPTAAHRISIPHKNDLDLGRRLVMRFADAALPQRAGDIDDCFTRRGAYGRFKRILEHEGQLDAWYAFEAEATELTRGQALIQLACRHHDEAGRQESPEHRVGQGQPFSRPPELAVFEAASSASRPPIPLGRRRLGRTRPYRSLNEIPLRSFGLVVLEIVAHVVIQIPFRTAQS